MKKLVNFLLVSAAVLATVACQREPQASNALPEEGVKEVTTQFVLNIAAAPTTKMTADAVQQNNNFRGITDAVIYTYKTGITESTPYVLSTDAVPEKEFDLTKLMLEGSLDNTLDSENKPNNNTGNNENTTASKRVLQLSIPLGVDAVSFYGKAIKASGVEDGDNKYGASNAVISGTPSGTEIAAKLILTDGDVHDEYDATARLMIFAINDILSTDVDEEDNDTFGTLEAVSWAQYGHRYEADHFPEATRYLKSTTTIAAGLMIDHELEGLEEILGKCYYLFTWMQPKVDATDTDPGRPRGDYRAGSSAAVKKMVMDMYKVISATSSATPTTAAEANANRLAGAILDRAFVYFNNKEDSIPDGNYEAVSTLKTRLVSTYKKVTEEYWNANFKGARDLNGYPFEDFGVPEGAAQLGFHAEGEGSYTKDEFYYYDPNKPLVNYTMTEFNPRKYLYPAELWYYVNSPIRTTSNDVTIDSYPDGVNNWNNSAWTGWTYPGKVEGGTRGVAVVNSINYGVAMLKSSVVFRDDITDNKLKDNRYNLTTPHEDNKSITVSNSLFELRGILVGGVNPRMNWQFLRKYNTGDYQYFDGVIYDHSMNSSTVPTLNPNYTLVYDNYNSSQPQLNQEDVYVSLEFVNKGEAFYGRDNMIPTDGVFYLVAKLPKPTSDQITELSTKWPTDHQIPPIYGVDGEEASAALKGTSKKIARIFIQDFVTTATFKIGEFSLQHAYYSIPDLRASQMSLGLSVDLQWNPGLDYEIDL